MDNDNKNLILSDEDSFQEYISLANTQINEIIQSQIKDNTLDFNK